MHHEQFVQVYIYDLIFVIPPRISLQIICKNFLGFLKIRPFPLRNERASLKRKFVGEGVCCDVAESGYNPVELILYHLGIPMGTVPVPYP